MLSISQTGCVVAHLP